LPLISLVINNHNYEAFLHEAIESALHQTYPRTEVIVVDDGSTDSSKNIISRFGDRIRTVFKKNGGQASTFNAGVSVSRGEILCFLDADDLCRPNRAERLVKLFRRLPADRPVMMSHRLENFGERVGTTTITPVHYTDLDGRRLEGDFLRISDPELAYEHARRLAYLPFLASPTSGISLNRSLLDIVFPIPEAHEVGADCLIVRAAMLAGEVYGTYEVLGSRRLHGRNHSRELQKHLVDEAFLSSMNDYLNRILQGAGKRPIISVFDSIGATRYYQFHGSTRNLLRLAFLVPRRCLCWWTLRFSVLALGCAITTALFRRRRESKGAPPPSGEESLP
jgi:glycosyltransferase involved in cell wall biosynthesis